MKKLIFESIATPDVPGYPDKYALLDDVGGLVSHGPCSCCPNPFRPSDGAAWALAYGFLACGKYDGQVIAHDKYGECILLENGNNLPARIPNVNHGGQCIISQVFVHSGETEFWRGSAGCLVLPPLEFTHLMKFFELLEHIVIGVVDYSGMGAAA